MNIRPSIISDNTKRSATLTERQWQVARLACRGLSNKQIAEKLGMAEGTVKIHLHAIYRRLDMRSRTDLIVHFGASRRAAVLNK
jgi:two-component system, NarL family, nitrate/nitrite response regulator NarL